jgi:branched-subunit amino acid ABC-type transport system permease component
MQAFLATSLSGLGLGAMISLLAVGIVVIFKGSGVINFSQGAVAMFSAFMYTQCVQVWNLPAPVSLLIVVLTASALAAAIDRVIMRPLTRAPMLAKVVATLGVLLLLEGSVQVLFNTSNTQAASLLPQSSSLFTGTISIFGTPAQKLSLWLLGLAVMLGIGLWAFFRFTTFGLVTRASAENPFGAILLGRSPATVGYVSWWIGCVLAALAGILIAPITQLAPDSLTLLVIPALAAALTGRFSSFGIVILAGSLIGAAQSYLTYVSADTGWFEPGVVIAFPFVVIVIAMSVTGRLIPGRGDLEAGRPPKSPRPTGRPIPLGTVVGYAIGIVALVSLGNGWADAIANSVIFALLGLSVVMVTGLAGQISLAQMSLAGVGAYLTSKLAESGGLPLLAVVPVAGLATAVLGLLLALPAMRVRGVSLAVVTLAAGLSIEYVILRSFKLSGGALGNPVPSPSIFGASFDSNKHPELFGVLCLTLFVIVALGVRNLRRSRTGRRDLAVRANERAATAMGIDLRLQKVGAFMFAAFIAGVGGSLLAYETGNVTVTRYTVFDGILLVALVYAGGIGSISGAIFAGLGASQGIIEHLIGNPRFFDEYAQIVTGLLLLITLVLQPDGAAVGVSEQLKHLQRRYRRCRPVPVESPETAEVASDVSRVV